MNQDADLGGLFSGWTAQTLRDRLAIEGLHLSSSLSPDLVASYALEFYATQNKTIPRPDPEDVPTEFQQGFRKSGGMRKSNRQDPFPIKSRRESSKTLERSLIQNLADEITESVASPTSAEGATSPRPNPIEADGSDANLIKARLRARSFLPQDSQGEKFRYWETTTGRFCTSSFMDVFDEGNESDFSKYGVGVSLYFKWLKWLFWTFFILSMVSVPQLAFNMNLIPVSVVVDSFGNQTLNVPLNVEWSLTQLLFEFTVGNIFFEEQNETVIDSFYILDGLSCEDETDELDSQLVERFDDYCMITIDQVELLYRLSDFVTLLVMFVSSIWLRIFTFKEKKLINRYYRKIEHYTLELGNLPKYINEEDLVDFLADNCFNGVSDKIFEVFLARNDSKFIGVYLQKGLVLEKMSMIVAEANTMVEKQASRIRQSLPNRRQGKIQAAELNRRELIKKYDSLYAQFLSLETQRQNISNNYASTVVRAFVTFQNRTALYQALRTLSLPKRVRPVFDGSALIAKQAAPPSSYLWENLEVTSSKRFFLILITVLVTIFSLAISVGVAFLAQSYRVELTVERQSNNDDSDPCSLLSFTAAARAVLYSADPCHGYWKSETGPFLFTQVSAGIIAAVNMFIIATTKALARFERHESLAARELSISVRQHLAMSLNVGMVIMLANSTLFAGQYDDLIAEWYANAGTQILLTITVTAMTPHMFPLLGFFSQRWKLFLHENEINELKSQLALDKLILGGEFYPSYRYSQQLTALTVTSIYAPGMTILYFVAAANFGVYFLIDKYLLISYYRTVSDFGSSLAEYASQVCFFCILLKAGMSLWVYSVPGLFLPIDESTDGVVDRVIGDADGQLLFVWGTLAIFSLSFVGLFMQNVVINWINKVLEIFSYSVDFMEDIQDEANFTSVEEGLKGGYFARAVLNTYNILENHRYQKAFGISRDFAATNVGVQSVIESEVDIVPPPLPDAIRQFHIDV